MKAIYAWRQHARRFRHTFKAGSLLWFTISLSAGVYAYCDAITKNGDTNTHNVSAYGIIAAIFSALITVVDRFFSHQKAKKRTIKSATRSQTQQEKPPNA